MNIISVAVPAVIPQSYLSEAQTRAIEKQGMVVIRSSTGDMDEVEFRGDAESRELEQRVISALQRISR